MINHLPKEFQFSHDYCLRLHDELAHFIVYGEKNGLFLTRFNLQSEEEKELNSNPEQDIWEWLEKRNRADVIGEMLLKSIFPGLLSDFCHFIFEALSCSRKGKLTVAYTLLRKPLKENLHYLEWLLADPEGLLTTFYNKESSELSFSHIGDPNRIKNVIQKTISRILNREAFEADFIYDLRYNKNSPFGFEFFWNRATHLITTKQPLQTERQNLNFIFSDYEAKLSQWYQIYRFLPYLLLYTVEICEILMGLINKKFMTDIAEAAFHRSLGFTLWGHEIYKLDGGTEKLSPGMDELKLDCPKCCQVIPPKLKRIRDLYDGKKVQCPSCSKYLTCLNFIKEEN